jgi:hypothetical protein
MWRPQSNKDCLDFTVYLVKNNACGLRKSLFNFVFHFHQKEYNNLCLNKRKRNTRNKAISRTEFIVCSKKVRGEVDRLSYCHLSVMEIMLADISTEVMRCTRACFSVEQDLSMQLSARNRTHNSVLRFITLSFLQDWSYCCNYIRSSTLREESNFPASALKKVVFPEPGAPRTSVILDEQQENEITLLLTYLICYLITCMHGN